MYFEYRIVKIEKGLFLIEFKTAPYGVWHEVKNKQFKTKPKAGRTDSFAYKEHAVLLSFLERSYLHF